jgi:hypothetical protein
MPVTIRPSLHGAKAYNNGPPFDDPADLLFSSCSRQEYDHVKDDNILHTSFSNLVAEDNIFDSSNGFLLGMIDAYNHHRHIVLRPDDIWFAVLLQLNNYISANSEEMRHLFVSHDSKKDLVIYSSKAGVKDFDYGHFMYQMSQLIGQNVKDPSLRDWMMPNFTTTTKIDQAVASILIMSSMKSYFNFALVTFCGFPSVTLLGEKEDWEKLEAKLDRLGDFGKEVEQWGMLLKTVMRRLVGCFEEGDGEESKDFWTRSVSYWSNMSGESYLSGMHSFPPYIGTDKGIGWITAFMYWDENGLSLRNKVSTAENCTAPPVLELDGRKFHCVSTKDVPPGFASVPVEIDDNGTRIHTRMVAGSVGLRVSSSGALLEGKNGNREAGLDTLQPESGWWIYERIDKEKNESAA